MLFRYIFWDQYVLSRYRTNIILLHPLGRGVVMDFCFCCFSIVRDNTHPVQSVHNERCIQIRRCNRKCDSASVIRLKIFRSFIPHDSPLSYAVAVAVATTWLIAYAEMMAATSDSVRVRVACSIRDMSAALGILMV